jgi:hypothetical protein
MAHFLTVVLVDPAEAAPADVAERLLRPYFAPDLADAPGAKCDSRPGLRLRVRAAGSSPRRLSWVCHWK